MATYRTTKTGVQVVFGTIDEVRAGIDARVQKSDGFYTIEYIGSVGRPFNTPVGMMVYGYIATRPVEVVGESDQEPWDEMDMEGNAEIEAERRMALSEAGFDF